MKKFITLVAVASLTFGLFATAEAEAKRKRVAEGIIIGIGIATLVGAAAAAAKKHEDSDVYYYQDRYDPRENAVAACLHQANRAVRRNGGEGVELRRVDSVRAVGSGSYLVDMRVRGYYDGDMDRHAVSCRVFRGEVRKFRMN